MHISASYVRAQSTLSRVQPELFSTMRRYVSAQWQMRGPLGPRCAHTLAASVCLWAFSLSLQSGRFAPDITAALVSPVSLRAPGCPSHCDAFSLAGARLCCSASTRGSACSHPWAAWAGGNLWTKQRCHSQESKSWNDAYRDRHREIICTPVMFHTPRP